MLGTPRDAELREIANDAAAFLLVGGQVPRVEKPSEIEFLRDYVAQNRPCILTGLLDGPEWTPARQDWTQDGLVRMAGDRVVRVNATPTGHGDCVVDDVFVKPHEVQMTLERMFELMADPESGIVPYLSHQNDNLRDPELDFLQRQVPSVLPLAKDTLGDLDAVNLWIGNERAVSAMHQDYYENLYAVIQGEKVFHLLPPVIHPQVYLGQRKFPQAHYVQNDLTKAWTVEREPDAEEVAWIPRDPLDQLIENPAFAPAFTECRVQEGEVLYLPAMWLHRATQSRLTVSVNYWHNMAFDHKWLGNNLVSVLTQDE
mmetsp:Transcript_12287/g.22800  ORF Transcript_12287/g.22800 Transcript_12287/m.22800 type:complete len:314 (+) Transcript_12287:19-960(+)